MFFHPWPFIERGLFENFRDYMNDQWRWQHIAKKVDIEGLFCIRQETYLIIIWFTRLNFELKASPV